MKIGIILGTRPEIIKMSPIIRQCEKLSIPFFILHTGQHYSYEMDSLFFQQLNLPRPFYNLDVGSGTHAVQTARIMVGVEEIVSQENPDVVLVQGDTNTVLAGVLASVKIHTKIGHVEAGLRSFDRSMPEEINRIVADHLSDFLFTPTETAKENLIKEGVSEEKIVTVGNTIVDSVQYNIEIANQKYSKLDVYSVNSKEYILVTIHRAENVDSLDKLVNIFKGLQVISEQHRYPIIFPVHPRTRKMIEQTHIDYGNITLTNPVGFFEFLNLESNARIVLTDSGGVQEETCILHVPCVTLRENTERPETIEVGSNILAGSDPQRIAACFNSMYNKRPDWKNPYGDGETGKKIVDYLISKNREN